MWFLVAAVAVSVLGVDTDRAASSVPKCEPPLAFRNVDYRPLDLATPRIPPIGDVEIEFTITPSGTVVDAVVARSRSNWKEWDEAVLRTLTNAEFQRPVKSCRQRMRFRFESE
jgi:TonB family protein